MNELCVRWMTKREGEKESGAEREKERERGRKEKKEAKAKAKAIRVERGETNGKRRKIATKISLEW